MRCIALLVASLACLAAGFEEEGFEEFESSSTLIRTRRAPKKTPVVEIYTFSDEMKEAVLEAHNEIRRNVKPPAANMRKMHWDDRLAQYGAQMSQACNMEATMRSEHPRLGRMGMNKFIKSNMLFNSSMIDEIFNDWLKEKKNFLYQPGFDQCKTGYSDCDNYKQVIWAKTFMVGCGATRCKDVKIKGRKTTKKSGLTFYCMYGPKGNQFAKLPYVEGKPCSACNDPRDTCQRKLCSNQERLRTPTSPGWMDWGPWSQCSRTCGGGGTAKRERVCNTYVEPDCEGTATQNRILCASYEPCPSGRASSTPRTRTTRRPRTTPRTRTTPASSGRWTKWGKWASCTSTCGAGTRLRRRTCLPKRVGVCRGPSAQPARCAGNPPCRAPTRRPTTRPTRRPTSAPHPRWGKWRSWSACSRTCGGGRRRRQRVCSVRRPGACRGTAVQSGTCNRQSCRKQTPLGWAKWSNWSRCTATCGRTGTRQRTRKCNSKACPGISRSVQTCNRETCLRTTPRTTPRRPTTTRATAASPAVSAWGPWAACTKRCGGGTKLRRRTCSRRGSCSQKLQQMWRCNTGPC